MSEEQFEIFESYMPSIEKQGDVGEIVTTQALRNDCKMKVLRNIYLPYKNRLSEIDIIGISKLGVFVVENKNYYGTIKGDIGDKYWTVNYCYDSSCKLYNPVLQNNLHKSLVKSLLVKEGFDSIPIYSPVIFNDKGVLDISNADKYVFNLSSFIRCYNSLDKEFISENQISALYEFLRQFSDISDEMKLIHKLLLKSK